MCNIQPLFFILLLLCSGCAANKSNIDYLQKEPPSPIQYTYDAGYLSVWQATIRALAEEEIIKTMNQDAGIVVTEFGTVEDVELDAIDTAMGARTYKYSYTINLRNMAPSKTEVSIKTNIKMSQIALYEREQSVPWVESYLRKKLFIRICNQLIPGGSERCNSLLTSKINYGSSPSIASVNELDANLPFRVLSESEDLLFRLQETLNVRGYSAGSPDGYMGPKTRVAIERFQKDTNIAVTGTSDPNTLIALGLKEGTVQKKVQKPDMDTPTPAPSDKKTIQIATDAELMQAKDPFSGTAEIIPKGSVLTVNKMEEDWYEVLYQGRTGYIHSTFVAKEGQVALVEQPSVKPKEKPAKKKSPVVNKKQSEIVEIVQEKNPLPEQQKVEEKVPQKVELGKGTVIETTSLLSAPSFMADTTQDINEGQKIVLLEKKEDFYKIRYKGKEGYIYAEFVEVTERLASTPND